MANVQYYTTVVHELCNHRIARVHERREHRHTRDRLAFTNHFVSSQYHTHKALYWMHNCIKRQQSCMAGGWPHCNEPTAAAMNKSFALASLLLRVRARLGLGLAACIGIGSE